MEKVSMQVSAGEGAVLKYNDHMLVTDHAWEGFIAAIYEFLESPNEIGGGHAIAWTIKQTSK